MAADTHPPHIFFRNYDPEDIRIVKRPICSIRKMDADVSASIGGCRVSLKNVMSDEGVDALFDLLESFAA